MTTHVAAPQSLTITPFRIDVPQGVLDDLQRRLEATRWPSDQTAAGWEQGPPVTVLRELLERWRTTYDWREHEARLNAVPQFTTVLDGQPIHYLHVRSPHPGALPLILTHGWPMSVFEYLDLVGPLTDPVAHGGSAEDAFDVVIPSRPGFGFSSPSADGSAWTSRRTARAWVELMHGLGYDRYGAAGNDGGSTISPEVGRADPASVVAVHVTQIFSFPSGDPAEFEGMSEQDLGRVQFLGSFFAERGAYNLLQSSQPYAVVPGLADSPLGQLAWSTQLFRDEVDPDWLLTNVTLYWLTNTSGSTALAYFDEAHDSEEKPGRTTVPLGLASFGNDFRSIRPLAERDHANIAQWNEYDVGGHFAPHQEPQIMVDDLRGFFRSFR